MIVFEGVDGTGKSTMALATVQALADRGTLEHYERYGVLPRDWDYCYDYLRSMKPWAVLDRFTLSEDVYGPVVRGGADFRFSARHRAIIAREAYRCGTLVVYLCCSLETSIKRRKRGDEFSNSIIKKAQAAYIDLLCREQYGYTLPRHGSTIMVLDTDKLSRKKLLGLALTTVLWRHARLQDKVGWYRDLKTDGHGPVDEHCQAVFVGEQQNDGPRRFNRAFIEGPAAEALHEMVIAAGLDPCQVHLVNAIQPDKTPLSWGALSWANAHGVPIVALGSTAADLLSGYGSKFIRGDHPMFVKRFFNRSIQDAGKWIGGEVLKARKANARSKDR